MMPVFSGNDRCRRSREEGDGRSCPINPGGFIRKIRVPFRLPSL
nr:MAG TPA_asm: hypothetical protein [Caudoviricetes sp.]